MREMGPDLTEGTMLVIALKQGSEGGHHYRCVMSLKDCAKNQTREQAA